MKAIWMFAPLVLLTLVVSAQTAKDIKQIEFSTSTRGSYKQVIFTPKEMMISEENRSSSKGEERQNKKLTATEWKNLCHSFGDVFIAGIPYLESPTMNRSFDGARTSTITISLKDGKTYGHSFDNENPNPKLQKLMDAITALSNGMKKE